MYLKDLAAAVEVMRPYLDADGPFRFEWATVYLVPLRPLSDEAAEKMRALGWMSAGLVWVKETGVA